MKGFIKSYKRLTKWIMSKMTPRVLTCIACGGVVATAYNARNNAIKEMAKDPDDMQGRIFCYVPTIISGAATMALIIFNAVTQERKIVSLMSIAGIGYKKYNELKEKAIDVLGREQFDEIEREIVREYEPGVVSAFSPPVSFIDNWNGEETYMDQAENGNVLFYDPLINDGGLWFRTSKEAIRLAWIKVAESYYKNSFASWYSFYENIGILLDPGYDELGWSTFNGDYPVMRLIPRFINDDPEDEPYYEIEYIEMPDSLFIHS